MARCATIQSNLTAWIDGELSGRRCEKIRAHLTHCASCAAAASSVREAIESHQRLLPMAMAVPDCNPEALWVQLRQERSIVGNEAGGWWKIGDRWRPWRWLVPPVAIATAALVLLMLLRISNRPSDVLIPLGVKPPPVAVSRQPELFKDYPLIEHLDALEHFDTVESEPLDDDQKAQRG